MNFLFQVVLAVVVALCIAMIFMIFSTMVTLTPEQHTLHYWKETIDIFAEVFTAIGTVGVAIMALWGDIIRYWIGGPRLTLALVRKEGHLARHPEKILMDDKTYRAGTKAVRHYHLRVSNRREWMPANKIKVCVQRIAKQLHAAQDYTETPIPWPIYLRYSFSETEAHKNPEPSIGAPLTCDFICIGERGGVPKLMLSMKPDSFNDLLEANQPCKLQIQAVGENAVSNKLYLKVTWNGQWHEGDAEMANNLSLVKLDNW